MSSKANGKVLPLFVVVCFLEVVSIVLLYFLNKQYGTLYQGIQDYNTNLIWNSIIIFCAIAGVLVFVGGFITYYTNKLAFFIRKGLTTLYLMNHCKDNLVPVDNVDQRIQEDLKVFGEKSCEFWFAVMRSLLKIPIFLGVVITLTSWYTSAIILSAIIIGTYITKLASKKIIELQVIQERNEANFRKTVANSGKDQLFYSMFNSFMQIHDTFLKINKQVKKLAFIQSGLGQTFVLLPFIVLMPLYIAKAITLGAFMQSVNALAKVIDSLTVLIENRQLIVGISTCIKRIEMLKEKDK